MAALLLPVGNGRKRVLACFTRLSKSRSSQASWKVYGQTPTIDIRCPHVKQDSPSFVAACPSLSKLHCMDSSVPFKEPQNQDAPVKARSSESLVAVSIQSEIFCAASEMPLGIT